MYAFMQNTIKISAQARLALCFRRLAPHKRVVLQLNDTLVAFGQL